MVIIRTVMNVLPEKQKEVLLTLLGLLQQPKKEKGCMSYEIFSDIEDKNIFNLISAWETRQHLNQHIRSDRFSILLGTKSLLSEPLKIEILTGLNSQGMETVHAVRKKFGLVDTAEMTTFTAQ